MPVRHNKAMPFAGMPPDCLRFLAELKENNDKSWFDANREALPPNGIHNEVDTREELARYDPALAELVAEVFPAGWRWSRR